MYIVLGINVGFGHDVPYFVDPRFEFSTLEDGGAGVEFEEPHCCRWDSAGGGPYRGDGIGTLPYAHTRPRHTFAQGAGTTLPGKARDNEYVPAESIA